MNPELEAYFNAFERSNQRPKSAGKITQKDLAESSGIREAEFSNVFRFLKKESNTAPTPAQYQNVLHCFKTHWDIDSVGFLVRKPESVKPKPAPAAPRSAQFGPPPASGLKSHSEYRSANIGAAVKSDGAKVRVINTYLSNYMHNPEADEGNQETLANWLMQGKKVQVLILHPERHSMRLRAKSLDMKGSDLANRLIGDLTTLLEYTNRYPDLLEVRLMDELPGISAVISEKRAFYGLHLAYGHTESTPYFEVPTKTPCNTYDHLTRHFDTIWNDSQRATPLSEKLIEKAQHALHGVRNQLGYLKGTWDLYLHDVSGTFDGETKAPFTSVVGSVVRWTLDITEPRRGIYLRAKLALSPEQVFEERLVTERIGQRDYAHLRFSDFHDLSIHLSFHCRLENSSEPMLGYFQITTGSDSCSGYAILTKKPTQDHVAPPLAAYFRRLLSFRDGSYQSLERVRHELDRFGRKLPFAGTYRVYSYGGRKGGEKGIKINWLHIDEAGIARYKNQRFPTGDELTGRATYIAPNLHIMSTYFRDGSPERRGYLIAKVAKNYPRKGRYYGAVNLGVSFERDQIPNGKRFVLEYAEGVNFETAEHAFLPVHSPEYKNLPESIRGLLSGRLKNLNGFLRSDGLISDLDDLNAEWHQSIKLAQVFYDSAVQHTRRGEYDEAVVMLFRAVNHGFDDLKKFEVEVSEFDWQGLHRMQNDPEYAKIQRVLSQDPEAFNPII
jgi:hypothetical protein